MEPAAAQARLILNSDNSLTLPKLFMDFTIEEVEILLSRQQVWYLMSKLTSIVILEWNSCYDCLGHSPTHFVSLISYLRFFRILTFFTFQAVIYRYREVYFEWAEKNLYNDTEVTSGKIMLQNRSLDPIAYRVWS